MGWKLIKLQQGQAMVEYSYLLGCVILVALLGLQLLGIDVLDLLRQSARMLP